MKISASYILILLLLSSCFKGKEADLIIHNARIYSFNLHGDVFEAMAIKDGKILELGSERKILNKYRGNSVNAEKKEIYPGFYDAHAHLLSLAEMKMSCDLTGSRSLQEVISRLERFEAQNNPKVLIGKGWDQSLWNNNELPDNSLLNTAFPEKPVILYRVDGHAILVNQTTIEKANITPQLVVEGGEIHYNESGLTGILLDNAIDLIHPVLPKKNNAALKKAIINCQEELLQYGITNINEAGIYLDQLELLQELENEGKLKINIYAMLFPGEAELEFARKNGIYKSEHIHVRSFKLIGDGALGSRGACLTHPYNDAPHTHGFMLSSHEKIKELALFAKEIGYQLNVHSIGDSTNRTILKIMVETLKDTKDRRWRIEHAQIVQPEDVEYFKTGIIPSVQPTHAVSDMRFVQDRIGKTREKWAYAYQSLLRANGIIALGTDFPVEDINPFNTIEAAVNRKNSAGEPRGGYLKEEALTLDQTIRGMTIWAAMASFEENEQGSLEPYKDATFIVLHNPIQDAATYTMNYAKDVYIRGQRVYHFN
jgi:predicted amidohydrolase YtcJ